MDLSRYFRDELDEHRQVIDRCADALAAPFGRLVEACAAAVGRGGKLLLFGNGGSAADAQHIATELTIRYRDDRRPIAAIALTTDSSALTACGNDLGFEQIFARQIEAVAKADDLALAISTSGKSPNILLALRQARAMGLVTAALSGGGGGNLAAFADHLVIVPCATTARIQEAHILLGHLLCGALEAKLGLVSAGKSKRSD
jgi:D-sedoheptulose 7-phosphate isomerase